MKKLIIFPILCILATMPVRETGAGTYGLLEPKANEVAIDRGCVEVPLGRMLLVRKDNHYFALKFIRNWIEVDEKTKNKLEPYRAKGIMDEKMVREGSEKKYSAYEVYSQGDGSGDFAMSNVVKNEYLASWLPLKGPFRPFIYQPGDSYVKCGPYKLVWRYRNRVCFIPSGESSLRDFGFEIAPTPWADISQVNVFDSRVKWYRYDENRERLFIPIDGLWEGEK